MAKPQRIYMRFVCYRNVESQRQRLGLFQALDEARECDFAPSWALKELGEVYGWFKTNLAVPGQFSRGGRKGRGQPGLSWFKPAAKHLFEPIPRYLEILANHNLPCDRYLSPAPGRILYEDAHQIVVVPTEPEEDVTTVMWLAPRR